MTAAELDVAALNAILADVTAPIVKALDLSLMLQPFGYSSLALKPYGLGRFQVMDRAAPWVLASQLLMLAPLVLLAWRMRRLDPSVSSTPRRGSADRRG